MRDVSSVLSAFTRVQTRAGGKWKMEIELCKSQMRMKEYMIWTISVVIQIAAKLVRENMIHFTLIINSKR